MKVYYNEWAAYPAQWLRNLIAAGHLPAGDVDERSITEVHPDDLRQYDQCHFFAGIGGWPLALQLAGWGNRPVWTGSCPCQPFSAAGAQRGSDDERHLWPAFFDLIRVCRPATVLGEQVSGAAGLAWLDHVCADLEGAGYATAAADLPACSVGAPHRRQRLWWVAHLLADADSGFRPDSGRVALVERDVLPKERRKETSDGSATRSTNGGVAHAELPGASRLGKHGRASETGPKDVSPASGSGRAGGMADADGAESGWRELRLHQAGGNGHGVAGAGEREENRMGDADHALLEGRGDESGEYAGQFAVGEASLDGMANGTGYGWDQGRTEPARQQGGSDAAQRGASDPWRDLEWLACSDGKARPTQPGLFPLAHGIPARVGRLRAYGNAIVPQVAAEFIKSVMDVAP